MTNSLDIHIELKNDLIQKMNVDLGDIQNNLKLILDNRQGILDLYFEQEYDSEFARQYTKEQFKFAIEDELSDLNKKMDELELSYRKFMKRMNLEEGLKEDFEITKINELKFLINSIIHKIIDVTTYHTVDLEAHKMIFDDLNQFDVSNELKMMLQSIETFQDESLEFVSFLISRFNLQDEIEYKQTLLEEED